MSTVVADSDAKRSVLGRAFDILDCFAEPEYELTVATLCERTGLPPATVHRLLATLVERGVVERCERGVYRLGMGLWRLGWGVPRARQVRDVARPHMVDLYSKTHEIVVRGFRDGDDILLVDQIAGRSSAPSVRSGRRFPLGSLAPGLVHLAHLPVDDLQRLIAERDIGLPARLVDSEFELLQVMAEIRRRGLSVAHGRRGPTWLAAPILGADGGLRSTMSLIVPRNRLKLHAHGEALRVTAQAVSSGLGAPSNTRDGLGLDRR